MRITVVFLLILTLVHARENPFFPSTHNETPPLSSYEVERYESLKQASISLPNQARVLEEVSIRYKTLDGSIESKTINVNRAIDWHLPLLITQAPNPTAPTQPLPTMAAATQEHVQFDLITFNVKPNTIDILHSDALIRNFMMVNPHRIVCDFKRKANFLSFEKALQTLPFKQIRIGNHSDYYRIVIELDGRYRHNIERITEGYRISIL